MSTNRYKRLVSLFLIIGLLIGSVTNFAVPAAAASSDSVVSKGSTYIGSTAYNLYWKNSGGTWDSWGEYWIKHIDYYNFQSGAIGYCIEPYDDSAGVGETRNPISLDNVPVPWKSSGKFEAEKTNAISLILAYGAPNNGDRSESGYYATALLVAEAASGYRAADGSIRIGNPPFYNAFVSATSGTALCSEVQTKYAAILTCLQNHGKIPSFSAGSRAEITNNKTITLNYNSSSGNYEASVTDTNGILSHFNYQSSVDGLSFSKSGNTLNISATPAAAAAINSNGITVNSRGHNVTIGPDSLIVWGTDSGAQSMVTMAAGIDPVPSYFKLRANVDGTLVIQKSTSTGSTLENWGFGVYTDPGCTNHITTLFTNGGGIASQSFAPGTYYLKEIYGGTSWWIYDSAVKQVNISAGQTTTIGFHNTYGGKLHIQKHTNTGENLGNWTFTIWDSAGYEFGRFTTDGNGNIVLGPMHPGVYTIAESGNGDPYWGCDTAVKTFTITPGQTTKLDVTNTHYGKLKVIKNTNTGNNRNGWSVGVYSDSACRNPVSGSPFTTGSDGSFTTGNLLPGTYYVKELSGGNDWWTMDKAVKSVTVSAGSTASVSISNTHNGRIQIVKETNTGANRDNWTFTVKNASGTVVGTYTTGADGTVTTGNLVPGTYTVTETARNDSYWVSDTTSKTVTVVAGQTASVTVRNTHRGLAEVQKATNTGQNLDGWEFTIYSDADCQNQVDSLTSGTDGKASVYLTPGTYYVKETGDNQNRSQDEYWTCDTEVKQFTITAGQNTTIEFTNTHFGKIKVQKTLDTDGDLQGWQFKITRASDNADMGSFVTDANGTFRTDKLLPGTYIVEEIFLQDSLFYCKSVNPQTVTVVEGATTELTFTNALRPGKITVEKVNFGGEHLSGATFLLEWSEDGTTWNHVVYSDKEDVIKGGCSNPELLGGCLTTNETGTLEFGNLYPGIQYRLTEVKAPNGYLLLADYAFLGELPVEDLTVSLTVHNAQEYELPTTGSTGFNTPMWGAIVTLIVLTSAVAVLYIPSEYWPFTNIKQNNNEKGRRKK